MARRPKRSNLAQQRLKKTSQDARHLDQETRKLFEHGLALHQKGQFVQAKIIYEQLLTKQPAHFDALHLMGVLALQNNNAAQAAEFIRRAISIDPNHAIALNNLGNALLELSRPEEALAIFDQSVALNPNLAETFNDRGNALIRVNRLEEALASYDKALSRDPNQPQTFNNRGAVLLILDRTEEALASYDKAIALKPDQAEAHKNYGILLSKLKRYDEAQTSFDRALALKPNLQFVLGAKLSAQMRSCDWSQLTTGLRQLEAALVGNQRVIDPLVLASLIDRPDLQFQASRIYVEAHSPSNYHFGDLSKGSADGKIRVGYFSADFRNHPVAYLMAELFESHDAERFVIYGFSFGLNKQDEMRKRVSAAFDHFFDVSNNSNHEVVQMARNLGIDIAVDLNGFTAGARTKIFAQRCAPIQINYLGYPGTMAAPYIDYIVADRTLIPKESQQYYSEKVVYMPHSFQVNDSKRRISEKAITRHEAGLPSTAFVFCCFNNNYKILPATFDGWMRLLKAVKDSVLWLKVDNLQAANNLRKEAQIRGVDSSRLVFAEKMLGLPDHLARHRLADLFIDTLPYNAHTTASDALWAGLPVLTMLGNSFAARVTSSLLQALDLAELITETQEQYESRAIELACNPAMLTAIRHKLEINRQSCALFSGQLFARHLEAAYTQMFQRQRLGLGPEHIYVDA